MQCLNAGWNQWQTEYVLYHAHLAKQCLYTSRIAIDKEQRVKFRKLMVNLPCRLIFAIKFQANHAGEFLWQSVSYNRNDAYSTAGNHRESESVVTANHVEIGRLVLDDIVDLFQTATCFFDGHDVCTIGGKTHCGFGLEVDAGTARYIIEYHGQGCSRRNGFEVLVKSLL